MTRFSSSAPHPMLYTVHQRLVSRPLSDIEGRVQAEFARWPGWQALPPGARIAVTAGSRGIGNIGRILRAVCDEVKRLGFEPFVVPAMGSHGGATVEGQVALLADLGITPETVGAPVLASLETDEVGCDRFGHPVLMDRFANRADGIIVINRIKKHTDFTATTESGLLKMITIGLGKHLQASHIHSYGAEGLRTLVPEYARIAIANTHILFGLAVLEDGFDATSDILLVPRNEIADQEPRLLRRAVRQMARLPMPKIDLLIVDYMGKNISGTGMDTNVIGRYRVPGVPEPRSPRVRYLAVLDLTEASHGNAIGVGLADLTTARLAAKVDQQNLYVNATTSGFLERGKLPMVCPTDQEAIDLALHLLTSTPRADVRVVRIQDTLHLSTFQASQAVVDDIKRLPGGEDDAAPQPLSFGDDGNLLAAK